LQGFAPRSGRPAGRGGRDERTLNGQIGCPDQKNDQIRGVGNFCVSPPGFDGRFAIASVQR
jgi:hypothetical protein